jgi:ankyrin repeat protein
MGSLYSELGCYWMACCEWARGTGAVVKLPLEKGDPDSKDSNGRTLLWWVTENGYEAVVKLLLEYDADPDSKDRNGRTPLLLAARNGYEAVVKLLVAKDRVDVNSKDAKRRQTPLSAAAEAGHEAVVKPLPNPPYGNIITVESLVGGWQSRHLEQATKG